MWERACSRIRSVSQQIHRLNHRIREQARSHIDLQCFKSCVLSALTFGPSHIRPTILLQMLNDDPRHILARGGFNPLQPRR